MKIQRIVLPILILTLLFTIASRASTTQTQPVDINELAKQSMYFGRLSKVQAAGLLQNAIQNGQQKKVMQRYLGVSPRIKVNITPDHINIIFRKFDGFTEKPVLWSREGAQMKDFESAWPQVADISASIMSDDQFGGPLEYLMLYLSNGQQKTTAIPLDLKPGGYDQSDIFLASLILNDTLPSSSTLETNIPIPEISATATDTAPSEPIPVDSPSSDIPQELETSGIKEMPDINKLPTIFKPTGQSTADAPSPPDSIEQRLQQLKTLYEKGLIDKDLYRKKQQLILQDL